MGKIRTKIIGLEAVEKEQKEKAKVRREEKRKREGIKVRAPGTKGGERMKQVVVAEEELKKMEKAKKILEKKEEKPEGKPSASAGKQKRLLKVKKRGKRYEEAKKKIKKGRLHSLEEAVDLLKKIKYSNFDETVELHINVKDRQVKGEVKLPFGIGKEIKVVIVDDAILGKIEKGNLNFDVLVVHPSFMSKLVKFARILGPRGLMPNPKDGTVTDKPEETVKKFQSGAVRFKTEAKFPIIHQSIGKLSFTEKKLVENIAAFINAVNKAKIETAYLKSTMSPSIKLDLEKI